MPRCVHCKEQFEDGDRFCSLCGSAATVDLSTGHYNRALDAGERGDLSTTIAELNECLCSDPLPRIAVVAYFNLAAAIWTQYNFAKRDGTSISDEEFRWAERACQSLRNVVQIYDAHLPPEDQNNEPLRKLYMDARKRLETTTGYGALCQDSHGKKVLRNDAVLMAIALAPMPCLDQAVLIRPPKISESSTNDVCASCRRGNRSNYAFCRHCGQRSNGATVRERVDIPEYCPNPPTTDESNPGTAQQIDPTSFPRGGFAPTSYAPSPSLGRTQWAPKRGRRRWIVGTVAAVIVPLAAFAFVHWRSGAKPILQAAKGPRTSSTPDLPQAKNQTPTSSAPGARPLQPRPVPALPVARLDPPASEPRTLNRTSARTSEDQRALEQQRRELDAQREELERQRLQMEQRQRQEAVQRERDEAEKRRQQEEIDKSRQDADNRQREIEQQRRKLLEDEQAKKKVPDERPYTGPSSGTLIWEGQVNGLQLVEIDNGSANVGTITGSLPGVACLIQPSNSKGVVIADPPRPANGFQRLVFRVQGKGRVAVRFSWVVQQAR